MYVFTFSYFENLTKISRWDPSTAYFYNFMKFYVRITLANLSKVNNIGIWTKISTVYKYPQPLVGVYERKLCPYSTTIEC